MDRCKKRIKKRLEERHWAHQEDPMMSASNIHYEISDRSRGLSVGGIGLIHTLVRRVGLVDAIGHRLQRTPDPTTAGDFCRRFRESDILDLMDAINEARVGVWEEQPDEFFEQAIIDVTPRSLCFS